MCKKITIAEAVVDVAVEVGCKIRKKVFPLRTLDQSSDVQQQHEKIRSMFTRAEDGPPELAVLLYQFQKKRYGYCHIDTKESNLITNKKKSKYLAKHNNKKTFFGNLILHQSSLIFQNLPIVNQQLLSTWIVVFALRIFNILFHRHYLFKNQTHKHKEPIHNIIYTSTQQDQSRNLKF